MRERDRVGGRTRAWTVCHVLLVHHTTLLHFVRGTLASASRHNTETPTRHANTRHHHSPHHSPQAGWDQRSCNERDPIAREQPRHIPHRGESVDGQQKERRQKVECCADTFVDQTDLEWAGRVSTVRQTISRVVPAILNEWATT